MARIPYVIPEKVTSPDVKQTFAQLPTILNLFKMMAHAETTFRPMVGLGSAILARQKLSAKLRELAVLRAAKIRGTLGCFDRVLFRGYLRPARSTSVPD